MRMQVFEIGLVFEGTSTSNAYYCQTFRRRSPLMGSLHSAAILADGEKALAASLRASVESRRVVPDEDESRERRRSSINRSLFHVNKISTNIAKRFLRVVD